MFDRIRFWWGKKPFYSENGRGVAFEKYHWSDDSVTVRISVRGYVSHHERCSRPIYIHRTKWRYAP